MSRPSAWGLIALFAACGMTPAGVAHGQSEDWAKARVFRGIPPDKGQWRVDLLDAPKGAPMPGTMRMCQDAIKAMAAKDDRQSRCNSRLISDSDSAGTIEIRCSGEKKPRLISIVREDSKTFLMDFQMNDGQRMKTRYTYEGACTSDSAMAMDKNSPRCRQMQSQLAKMDPAKACAGVPADQRAGCVENMRMQFESAARMCQ